MNKVFITSYSAISSLGIGISNTLKNLKLKKRNIVFPNKNNKYSLPYFPILGNLNYDKTKNRCSQIALELFSLTEKDWLPIAPIPVFSATSTGGIKETEDNYNDIINNKKSYPIFEKHFFNSIYYDLKKKYKDKIEEYYTFSTACSSSGHSLMQAFKMIKEGIIDKAIILGVDVLSFTTMRGFNSLKLISPTGTKPLTIERDGLTLGEGGGILLLESNPHLKPVAEIIGAASTTDGYHISSPDPEGIQQKACILKAVNEAKIETTKIDYINAHGTGTIINDETEMNVIKSIFSKNTTITSLKSYIGHTLGASAVTDIAISIGMLKEGYIYQLDNLGTPLDKDYIPYNTIKKTVKYFVKNSFGFGGNNISLVIKNNF